MSDEQNIKTQISIVSTMKLVYYDCGFNEFKFKTSKKMSHFGSYMTSCNVNFHGYNESGLKQTFFVGPKEFVLTE